MTHAPERELAMIDAVTSPPDSGSRPKVMFILSHSANGGAQELWVNLAEAFHARGYHACLAALYQPSGEDVMPTTGALGWLDVQERRTGSRLGDLGLIPALARFLRHHDPDVIFTALPAAGVLVPLVVQMTGLKARVVVSHHTPVDTYAPILSRLDAISGRLPKVEAIVSVSKAVGASLDGRSGGYRAKTKVIRNSLPPALERHLGGLAERRRGRPAGRKLTAIGRLAPQKNYPVLLRAMARVENALLTIVGGGSDEGHLQALARDLGVADRVRFTGQMSRLEALEVLADSDVFLQPSLFEGHSLALIEAATLGVPLIVSRVPAQVEGVTADDDTICGVIISAQDDEALAAAMQRMLDDQNYREAWTQRSQDLGKSLTFARTVASYESFLCRP